MNTKFYTLGTFEFPADALIIKGKLYVMAVFQVQQNLIEWLALNGNGYLLRTGWQGSCHQEDGPYVTGKFAQCI